VSAVADWGFSVARLGGERGVLAHVEMPGPPRVGRYGVDLPTFERSPTPPWKRPVSTTS
jgi:nucleoside-triphosphatase